MHGKFIWITVNFDMTQYGIYVIQMSLTFDLQWNVTPLLGHFGGRVGICGIIFS